MLYAILYNWAQVQSNYGLGKVAYVKWVLDNRIRGEKQ